MWSLVGIDVEVLHHVGLGAFGDADHRVGHFDCGLLDPAAAVVAAAELLALPRAQRLEGVRGDDERDAVVELRKDAGHVRVPGVAVHDVGIVAVGVEVEALLEAGEHALQFLRAGVAALVDLVASGGQRRLCDVLLAEAAHIDVHQLGQFAGEVVHVDAGAAVNSRGGNSFE